MEPTAEVLDLPDGYRTAPQTITLTWDEVRGKLAAAQSYWLATTRPDGRPHVVPVDGLWVEDRFYFSGGEQTVHIRNLREDGRAGVHLEDAKAAVIVEGRAALVRLDPALAARVEAADREKYGYGAFTPEAWELTPERVLAWNWLPQDATRFTWT
ncbi:pyridoxamine 5'-phosphate oxidase family protein [Nonomuraea typhae]|uniref:pyridoxamine 5'-phosphate oxidase family protein n=1 Tax=Nonomuraea typhae TaxID=2603600 RepID=UPI0012F84994|nr:pyridoxamine 5'-phosphate oxidase family protein [Nonomuraea typhae]